MNKTSVIILGAGPMQVPAIRAARELGLFVIAADRNEAAEGFALADLALPIDIADHRRLADWAWENRERYAIGAVFAGADVAVTAAVVNARLGLAGIPVAAAERAKNKALMKQCWLADGVPTPRSIEVADAEAARRAVAMIGGSVIVKPADNSASRGMQVLHTAEGLEAAVANALRYSGTGSCLIEEFVVGDEQSVETVMHQGRQLRAGIVDRHFGYLPYPIETGHTNPTLLDGATQEAIYRVVEAAALSLGITDGPAKADMILTARGPMILEMPARLSGGFHSQYTTPLATGMQPIRAVLRQSLGDPDFADDLQPRWSRYASCRALFPQPGRVHAVHGLEETRALAGVEQVFLFKSAGDVISDYRNCADRPCYVIAAADSRGELEDVYRRVAATLRFEMEAVA